MGLFFTKGVEELVVKIQDKYTYKVFPETEIVNLRISATCNWCIQLATDEILERNTSYFWVFRKK